MNIEQLAADLEAAKRTEKAATEARVAVELLLADAVGRPDEGSKTVKHGDVKITVTQKINRKLDVKGYLTIVGQIPEHLRPVTFAETHKIDDAGVRYLKQKEPGLFKVLAKVLTETLAKPSVKVERVEKED